MKEHRLEAYATLFSGLSSDLSEPSRELSPCTCCNDATAQCSIGFQPVFRRMALNIMLHCSPKWGALSHCVPNAGARHLQAPCSTSNQLTLSLSLSKRRASPSPMDQTAKVIRTQTFREQPLPALW